MDMLPNHAREDRPWGSFERFTDNEQSTVKLLRVDAGKRLSLQSHVKRSEFWHVVRGEGTVIVGTEERAVTVGDDIAVPVGTKHRIEGGPEGIEVLEIALGAFDEADIKRYEDDFGRS